MVIPVGPVFNEYATEVKEKVFEAGFCCEVDVDAGDTMNKKIRNAQLAQFNFIFGKAWDLKPITVSQPVYSNQGQQLGDIPTCLVQVNDLLA